MAQPRAHQILMRGDAEHLPEQPQEMERADAGLIRGILKVDLAMRMGVDPQRGFHGAATVTQRRIHGLWRAACDHFDKAAGKEVPDLVKADVAVAICRL